MISAGNKRQSLIEYLVRKAALTGTYKGQGRLFVCDLRARSSPTFHPTELWLAISENWLVAAQSSRLAEFGGRGMSFNICRGTLGSLAMFTAIRNASSRDSRFIDICR
jgi:hypothetical protein